jgi:hypothetical protein
LNQQKKLQQAWRSVGFAGNPQENILWQKFRQINDTLFAQRQALKSLEKAELASQQQNIEDQLMTLDAMLLSKLNEPDKPSLLALNLEVETLLQEVTRQSPVLKNITSRLGTMKVSIEQALSQIDKKFAIQSWLSLFTLITEQTTNKKSVEDLIVTTEFEQLTGFWQKRLIEYSKLSHKAQANTRIEKTLEIEILAKVDSPKELSEQRMVVQVKLMQQQMLSGGNIDLSKELVSWLMLGQLQIDDLPLLSRLKTVFVIH